MCTWLLTCPPALYSSRQIHIHADKHWECQRLSTDGNCWQKNLKGIFSIDEKRGNKIRTMEKSNNIKAETKNTTNTRELFVFSWKMILYLLLVLRKRPTIWLSEAWSLTMHLSICCENKEPLLWEINVSKFLETTENVILSIGLCPVVPLNGVQN